MLQVLWGIGGMAFILLIAWLLSVDRRKIRFRTVSLALLVQVIFAVVVLYIPAGQTALTTLTSAVQAVIDSSSAGIDFLFGAILPDEGSVFAFQVLPVIVFFASLTAVLYHVGLLQLVTKWIGGALAKLLGTTGPAAIGPHRLLAARGQPGVPHRGELHGRPGGPADGQDPRPGRCDGRHRAHRGRG